MADCYNEEEQMSAWCCYLGEALPFPFSAKVKRRDDSCLLKVSELVTVVGMAEDDCSDTIRVLVKLDGRSFPTFRLISFLAYCL